jgi:hypothetical protein
VKVVVYRGVLYQGLTALHGNPIKHITACAKIMPITSFCNRKRKRRRELKNVTCYFGMPFLQIGFDDCHSHIKCAMPMVKTANLRLMISKLQYSQEYGTMIQPIFLHSFLS